MSDLFNSNKVNKSNLASLFGEQPESEKEFFPEPFYVPSVHFSSLKVEKLCREFEIRTYHPRALLTMVTMATAGLLDASLLGPESPLNDEVSLPYGDKELLPKYTPTYFVLPYDKPFIKQLLYQYSQTESPASAGILREIIGKMKTEAYGNGSIEGQLSRLKDMYKIRYKNGEIQCTDSIELFRSAVGKGASEADFCYSFSRYLPLNRPDDIPGEAWPGLFNKPSSYLVPGEQNSFFPSINMNSISGMPYGTLSKSKTITEALVLSDCFMTAVSTMIKDLVNTLSAQTVKVTREKLAELLKEFWYFGCGLLFPKAERYDTEKWFTKTRNIYACPFPTHLIASLISNVTTKYVSNATTHNTPSLYAFSPFHGGLDRIIKKVIDTKHTASFVYADNWYIAYWDEETQSHDWYSLDFEKAESQVTLSDATLLAYYLLTYGHTLRDGTIAYNSSWAFTALKIIPNMFIDPTCLLGNVQLKFPGQGSGNTWTFLLNHLKSSSVDMLWRSKGMPRPSVDDKSMFYLKVLHKSKIKLKIELEVNNLESKLQAMVDDVVTGYMGDGSNRPPERISTVQLDLLGWDCTYSHKLDRYIPILNEGRLASSIAMAKKDVSRDFKERPFFEKIYSVARMETIRLVGGWAYDAIDAAASRLADEARLYLLRKYGDILTSDDWVTAVQNTEFGNLTDMLSVDISVPVTADKLLTLHTGDPTESLSDECVRSMASWDSKAGPLLTSTYKLSPRDVEGIKMSGIGTPLRNSVEKTDIYATSLLKQGMGFKKNELMSTKIGTPEYKKLSKEYSKMMTEADEEIATIYQMLRNPNTNLPSTTPNRMTVDVSNPLVAGKVPFDKTDKERPAFLAPGTMRSVIETGSHKSSFDMSKTSRNRLSEFANLSRSARKHKREKEMSRIPEEP